MKTAALYLHAKRDRWAMHLVEWSLKLPKKIIEITRNKSKTNKLVKRDFLLQMSSNRIVQMSAEHRERCNWGVQSGPVCLNGCRFLRGMPCITALWMEAGRGGVAPHILSHQYHWAIDTPRGAPTLPFIYPLILTNMPQFKFRPCMFFISPF